MTQEIITKKIKLIKFRFKNASIKELYLEK